MTEPFDLARYAAAVFDLDGTVWLSEKPMPGALDFLGRVRDLGLTVTFATNATAFSVEHITQLLVECGLGREGDGVVTGGSVVARSLAARDVRQVIGIAPPAMAAAIEAEGVEFLDAPEGPPTDGWDAPSPGRALVMGAFRGATFGSVERIGHLTTYGHQLYVTSLDPGYPALGRMEPGGGMLVSALRALYPVEPYVLGKPSREYADVIRALLRTDGPVAMFGDSQRADMGIAAHLGADGVLLSPTGRVSTDLTLPHYVATGLDAEIRVYEH